jgi:hypothetical protein
VLIGAAVVGAASIWLAASAKTDFEKRYDGTKIGMPFVEALAMVEMDGALVESTSFSDGQKRHARYVVTNEGEQAELVFVDDQLTEKEFTPSPGIERLRRLWSRGFKFDPPF